MLLDERGYYLTVRSYGADGRNLILAHEAAVTFDVGTKNSGELPLDVLRFHESFGNKRMSVGTILSLN